MNNRLVSQSLNKTLESISHLHTAAAKRLTSTESLNRAKAKNTLRTVEKLAERNQLFDKNATEDQFKQITKMNDRQLWLKRVLTQKEDIFTLVTRKRPTPWMLLTQIYPDFYSNKS